MKNNYLHYTFFGAMLLLFFCMPNHTLGNEKFNTSSNNTSENLNTTRLSFLTNSISFMSSAVHTNKVGFMAEADSFKSLDEEFGCYVEMPTLHVDGTCVQASEAPDSYGDEVEFMWLERRNNEFIPLTDWSINTALNFCPDTAGYYRMCARTVGCTDIYEATEVYVSNIDCGSLSGLYIYDQQNDQRAFGPISNGQDISIDVLPSTYYLVAETTGHVGSVSISVNNQQITENVTPFTYPGGGETGNNWNVGLGEYNIHASAYRNDNAAGTTCGTLDINFNIVQNCDLTVNAGNDIEVCQEDSIVLTATAENENTCTGSCVYPIIESDRCSGGNPSEIWMSNSGNNFFNTTIHSNFEILEDGTAIYESQVFNGTDTLDVHITFTGRTSTPPSGSPKLGCDTNDTSEYVYWTTTTGTIVSENHGTYQLTRMGEAFQLGIGGDVTRTGLGASGWFNLTGGDGFYTRGDVNIKLGECVPNTTTNSVAYTWTTTDGNIVGDANQQSITVNESGTYTVKAEDCKDCIANDEIVVTLTNAPEVTANNLTESVTISQGESFPEVTFTNGEVISYSENDSDSLCEIELSSHENFNSKNLWFHSFPEEYNKNFLWKDGYVLVKEDGTAEIFGTITNIDLPDSGFHLHYYFEELKDFDTWIASGGYQNTDDNASERRYARVDFNKPNSIVGFGEFSDSDLQLISTGNVAHMDYGPRDVYGGFGVGFWIDYEGTVNGMPAGNTMSTSGANHNDMYSAIGDCVEAPEATCSNLIVRHWVVEDACGVQTTFVQTVLVNNEVEANAGEDVTISSGASTTLVATGGGSYVWSTGETTDSIIVSPTETTSYSVMVTSDNGECTDADIVVVTVDCDLEVNLGEDVSFCSQTEAVLIAAVVNNTSSASIIASYNVTDADTSQGICENVHGNEQGVILQKGNEDFPITGRYNAWRVYNELILNEYDDNTAKITGTVIDEQGKIGNVDMLLYDKQNQGNSWSNDCYLDGLVGPQVFYQSFYGTITVDGVSYTVEPKASKQHFVFAEGASLESGQFGFGAWTSGTFGHGGEWFGNLEPREFNNCDEVTYLWSTGETTQSINVSPDTTTTYTVTVKNCDDCEATDELVIELGPALTVNAGEDVEVCQEESVELSASVENAKECVGGCEYPIIESERCAGGDIAEIWMINDGINMFNTTLNSSFKVFEDGTATYVSSVSNGTDIVDVNILFTGRTTIAPEGSPKLGCDTDDASGYVYYTNTSGTVISQNHGTFQVSRMGEAFQLGIGGDVARTGFGASGWFYLSGGDGYYERGDVNIKLGECVTVLPTANVDYVWTTEDGNIVGEANQESITVNESGTYKIVAKDCKNCEAEDEVKVIITNPQAGEMTADADTVCLNNDFVTISATSNGSQNIPADYTQGYVLTSGDNLIIQGLSTNPEFEVSESGKYTIHSFVYPTSFDPLSVVTIGTTTGGDVNALLIQGGGSLCASLDVAGAMVIVNDKLILGDLVWIDENQNGLQDNGEIGVNGVTATLFQNDGTEIKSNVTANDTNTGEPGAYQFEVCPNSGEYYVVFTGLPNGFEITGQNAGNDELDSDINNNGRTDTFNVLDESILTIDAGIFLPCAITPEITSIDSICSGEEVLLTASGGDIFQWKENGADIQGAITDTLSVFPNSTTTYSVIVTDSAQFECIGEVSKEIVVYELPTANAGEDVAICIGEEITLTALGGDTYLWSNGATTATITVSPQATTEYSVTVSSAQGCEDRDTVLVTVNELPTAIAGEDVAICVGEEITLTAAGGDAYLWSNGETTNSITVSPQATTEYNVTVSSAQGCEDTDTVLVTVNELPTAIAGEDVAICVGEEITLTAAGGDAYLWSNGATTATITVSPQATTEYSVIVSSAQGCEDTDTVLVTVNELPTANAGENVAICVGEEITLTAAGGDAYLWSNGETTNSITVSPQATTEYNVTVSSAQGCEDTDTVLVTVNELPTAIAGEDVAICVGEEITLTAAGGDAYLWSNGATTATITVSPQATTEYSVIVSSAQGCEDTDTVLVTVNELPTANAGENVAICVGEEITLTAAGGDAYLWSNGETTNSITVSPQATTEYNVTVSSAQGCEDTDTVLVTVNELPAAIAGEDVAICVGEEITLTAAGGDAYLWSNGETTNSITVSPQATTEYNVTVSSAQGCEDTDTVLVTVNELPTANAGEDVAICVGEEITLTATGGDTYLWSNGETTSSINVAPESTTEYGVIVTSIAGCEDMDTVTVTVNQKVTIGDFVFEDMNGDGIQDAEDTGINGVTVKLFECDSFYGNAHGDLVDSFVTTYNPLTGNPGYYSFDVCQNSGSYYIIFEDIPTGYNFTSQGTAAADLDSDVNLDGVTTCFDVTDMDNATIDAGLKAETCGMGIGSKLLPRDPQGLYTVRNADEACIGDDFYLWLFLDEENLSNYTDYRGEDMQGWSFTYEFPNGTTFTQDDSTNNSYRTQVYSLTEEDFGTYKISWTSPEGCNGLTSFDLSLAQECLKDGSRPTAIPMIAMVYPVPALASSELSIVINTVNQSVEDTGNGTIQAYGLQTLLPQVKETVDAILYDTNGKIVGASKTFEVDRGRALVKYPLGNLATGNYILLISGEDWSDSKQIIIE